MSILKELTALNEAKNPKLPDPDKFGKGSDFKYSEFVEAYLNALNIAFTDDYSNGDTYTITVERTDIMDQHGDDDEAYEEAMYKASEALDALAEILEARGLYAHTDSDAGDPQLVIDYREFEEDYTEDDEDDEND